MTAVLRATDALRNDRPLNDDFEYSSDTDWEAKYHEVLDMLTEARAELEEFQKTSREIEAELETELERTDRAQQDLRVKVAKVEQEKEEWKSKFMSLQTTHNTTTTSLQHELDTLRQDHQKIKVQLRELEMGNDDLERNERVIASSLADAEQKYSRVLEEKILLEHELLDKANLEEETQRLKDELREANEEIAILREQLEALQRNATIREGISLPSDSATSLSPSQTESLLSTPAPPEISDLYVSDLAPPDTPAKDVLPSIPEPSHDKVTPPQRRSLPLPSVHTRTSEPSSLSSSGAPASSRLARSTTVTTIPIQTTSRVPPRTTSYSSRSIGTASTATSAGRSQSKGVQMVKDMRNRVKVLEDKLGKVPRLRLSSITGRTNNAPPPPVPPVPPVPPKAGSSSRNSTSRIPSPIPPSSSSPPKAHSLDIKSGSKARRQTITSAGESERTPVRDTSGWVLIMEDSPSPVKEKDKEKERRRASGPSAPSAYRLSGSSVSPTTSNISRPPSALSQSVAPSSIRSVSRLSLDTEGRSSTSTNATTSTASSIPTPVSRPATPNTLSPSSGFGYKPSSTAYHHNFGLKRSPVPIPAAAAIANRERKRSSLGSSTSGSHPTLAAPPSLIPSPSFLSSSTNPTVQLKTITTNRLAPSPSLLQQSKLGRPPNSPRKNKDKDKDKDNYNRALREGEGAESDTAAGIKFGRGRAGTAASALFGRGPS